MAKSNLNKIIFSLVFLVLALNLVSACPVPVYRFWNLQTSAHLFTINETEKQEKLSDTNFIYEGEAFYVYEKSIKGTAPVYKFSNNKIKDTYFYTISKEERDWLINNHSDMFTHEGIAFYAYTKQKENTAPVYRFWNTKVGSTHFYTTNQAEKYNLIENHNIVFTYEGAVFYAYKGEINDTFPEPGIISNLRIKNKSENSIQWEWQNPENFSKIIIYINNVNIANFSEGNSYKAENLEQNTAYTITIKIIDYFGQIGESVSHTAKTLATKEDDSQTKKKVIIKEVKEEPIIFTSSNFTKTPLVLNEISQTKQQSENSFNLIYPILILIILLIIITTALILKNI